MRGSEEKCGQAAARFLKRWRCLRKETGMTGKGHWPMAQSLNWRSTPVEKRAMTTCANTHWQQERSCGGALGGAGGGRFDGEREGEGLGPRGRRGDEDTLTVLTLLTLLVKVHLWKSDREFA